MRRFLAAKDGRCFGLGMSRVSAALALCAFGLVLGGEHHAVAGPVADPDFDSDFLSDAQEWVLGTNPLASDTDGDGFGDLEELARGSSPVLANQTPTNAVPVHIGMTAHAGSDGRIHVLVAMHSTVQNPRSIQLSFGAQIDQRVFMMSSTWLATHSTMQVTTGSGGQSLLTLMDIPFSSSAILAAGHMTFFATVSIPGSSVLSADAVSLVNVEGVVALLGPPPPQNGQTSVLPGSIYIPLPSGGPGSVPSSWSEGSVCYQRAAPVAVNGAVVTQEVVSAGCVEGFEGYCPPSCAASVGSTYSTIDPIGLIGG